jgi:hypothetical protein
VDVVIVQYDIEKQKRARAKLGRGGRKQHDIDMQTRLQNVIPQSHVKDNDGIALKQQRNTTCV